MPPANNSHGERIVALETGQKALQESLQKLAEIVGEQSESQAREHGHTRKEIALLAEKLGTVGKPNYGVVIAGCSLVCMLVAAVLSPFYMQIQTNAKQLEKITDNFHAHEMLPIHPVAATILEEREKSLQLETDLRDKLNRAQYDLLRMEMKHIETKP